MKLRTVQPGDTLYDITLSQGLSMGQFLADNGLKFHPAAVGQALLIQKGTKFHMVRTGETLRSIAAQHRLSPDALLRLNPGISCVFPGQKLIVRREQQPDRPPLALFQGDEEMLTPLPLLAPAERTGRQYESLRFEEQAERADLVLLRTPESCRPVPLPVLRARLDWAVTAIPREKLVLELDGLGRDRVISGGSALLTMGGAENLAAGQRAAIRFDPAAQLARFRYSDEQGREHAVEFPDLRTLEARLETVRALRLRGVALRHPAPAAVLLLEAYFHLNPPRKSELRSGFYPPVVVK